jgi:hypothetical protein
MKLWIVGKVLNEKTCSWEFIGVFDSECKADFACLDSSYFFAPVTLNEAFPDYTVDFPEARYPRT